MLTWINFVFFMNWRCLRFWLGLVRQFIFFSIIIFCKCYVLSPPLSSYIFIPVALIMVMVMIMIVFITATTTTK